VSAWSRRALCARRAPVSLTAVTAVRNEVMCLLRRFAADTGAAVLAGHHTTKAGQIAGTRAIARQRPPGPGDRARPGGPAGAGPAGAQDGHRQRPGARRPAQKRGGSRLGGRRLRRRAARSLGERVGYVEPGGVSRAGDRVRRAVRQLPVQPGYQLHGRALYWPDEHATSWVIAFNWRRPIDSPVPMPTSLRNAAELVVATWCHVAGMAS
jgi:hypothetical protein